LLDCRHLSLGNGAFAGNQHQHRGDEKLAHLPGVTRKYGKMKGRHDHPPLPVPMAISLLMLLAHFVGDY